MGGKNKIKKNGVHGKIFINLNNETLVCYGRLLFLEAIDQLGSISGAARKMGYSYRKAWGLVERTNRAAGKTIVETLTGGAHGGGARLTDDGKRMVELVRIFLEENRKLTDSMWERFCREFPPRSGPL